MSLLLRSGAPSAVTRAVHVPGDVSPDARCGIDASADPAREPEMPPVAGIRFPQAAIVRRRCRVKSALVAASNLFVGRAVGGSLAICSRHHVRQAHYNANADDGSN